jgi:hypothetical protein
MNVAKDHKADKRLEIAAIHKMISCADSLSKSTTSGLPTIFLCSDSVLVKEYAKKVYGERLYISSLIPFHSDREGVDPGNGTLGTWTDIIMLGLADGIVLSSSGYGVLAAQIGLYNQSQIVTSSQCKQSM